MPCLRSPTPLVLLRPFRNPPNWRMPTSGQPSTYRASRSSCLTLTPLTNLMACTLRDVPGGRNPSLVAHHTVMTTFPRACPSSR